MQKEQKQRKEWGPLPFLMIAAVVLSFCIGWSVGNAKASDAHASELKFVDMKMQDLSRNLGYALNGEANDGVYWKDVTDAISELCMTRLPMPHEGVGVEQREAIRDLLDRTAYLAYTMRFDGQPGDPATQETIAELRELYSTYYIGLYTSADPLQDLLARIAGQG